MAILSRALVLVLLLVTSVNAQPQSSAQQACIVSYNKAALRLARARAQAFEPCLVAATAGERHVETCLTHDPNGKIASAEAKLAQVESTRCATVPDFGHGALAAATGTASAETIGMLRQLHVTLPPGWPMSFSPACTGVVDGWAQKLLQAKFKAFVRCKKSGLAAGTISSAATLAACLDAGKAAANAKTQKIVDAIVKAVPKACPFSSYLAGCSDQTASGIAACMDRTADCRACQFVNGVDGAATDCDTFDDGTVNASCPDACGNGTVGAGLPSWETETCDDANFANGDGCDSNCTVSAGGNGVVTSGEFCDERMGRCTGGQLDGTPCERNEECADGYCTNCPPGGCSNDCSACGAGVCCDTRWGCLFSYAEENGCVESGGTEIACDNATCQYSGTCCKHLFLDWGGCHSDPNVLANCTNWGGHFSPCSECEPCCKFEGYCTSWNRFECLQYEGTPVDCAECWAP